MRLTYLSLSFILIVVLGCKEGGSGGAGGNGGGAAGNAAGSGGGAAAAGGRGGVGGAGGQGGGPLTACPAFRPMPGAACTGTFTCNYDVMCICGVCCMYGYSCQGGMIALLGFNDGCTQINPQSCQDGGADANRDARGSACTPGANQSCNDNPAISSIRGTCTDAGTCICNNDASPVASSGRCP